jgi:RNA recognition motif-containing protein
VTNLPHECNLEDLWKVFGRFGRLGDVYIPKKGDKWGRKFAFVKFREVNEVEELSRRLEDVWLGSFKLRVNISRFSRRVEEGVKEEVARKGVMSEGEGSKAQNRSFKAALLQASTSQEEIGVRRNEGEVGREVLEVEVEGSVLKELEESFVGKLAINLEVYRIRTVLFMEGFAHISVTDMGGRMVLIHSPKKGEVETLWKTKADWITYYFSKVIPWSPACFANRRETWVMVCLVQEKWGREK